MTASENIQQFYKRIQKNDALELTENNSGAGHFNVFSRESCGITPYNRRDFYKVSLIFGTGKLHYADKWVEIDKPALLFSNPLVPYSWEPESKSQMGWYCLFSESFVGVGNDKNFLRESPLFRAGGNPIYFLNKEKQAEISAVFLKMVGEMESDYIHKYSVLRNYLQIIIHEALKMRPVAEFRPHANASTRITELFLELLERQFPVDTPYAELKLKTANDYARNLSVHTNHLNRSVKECTGKTTTEHIASRITDEAKALLQNTNWNITEIAYGLGFEYPSYFTNFFKKQTGITPNSLRN